MFLTDFSIALWIAIIWLNKYIEIILIKKISKWQK